MNFGGYVPLKRGLIEHTMDGRLTNTEALVFVWLLMLADRKTGSYTINQPTLRTFLPGLKKGSAQDALEGLERKRYIYRDVKPREQVAYRYWIEGFTPTEGPYKNRQLDLSEVFATKDTSKLRYTGHPPETRPVTTPVTTPATRPANPNSNKKGEGRREKETTTYPNKHGESFGDPNGEADGDEHSEPNGDSGGERKGERNGDSNGERKGDDLAPLLRDLEFRDGDWFVKGGRTKVHPSVALLLKGKEVTL